MAAADVVVSDEVYTWVTGGLLTSFIGKPVTLLAQFMSNEAGGRFIKLKLTDESIIMATAVHGADYFEKDSWLFLRGVVESRNKIKTELALSIPEEMTAKFEKSVYNEAITLFVEEGTNYLTVDKKDLFDHFGTTEPGDNGEHLDLIAVDSTATGGASAANTSTNNGGTDMQFDEFNGSNMW